MAACVNILIPIAPLLRHHPGWTLGALALCDESGQPSSINSQHLFRPFASDAGGKGLFPGHALGHSILPGHDPALPGAARREASASTHSAGKKMREALHHPRGRCPMNSCSEAGLRVNLEWQVSGAQPDAAYDGYGSIAGPHERMLTGPDFCGSGARVLP